MTAIATKEAPKSIKETRKELRQSLKAKPVHTDIDLSKEIELLRELLDSQKLDVETKNKIKNVLNKNVEKQTNRRLNVLELTPEAQKPPEFDNPPGVPLDEEDNRYWPTRYVMTPNPKDFETGDLIYSIQEDKSFIVLSELQQTKEWQATHHLPPMNLISKVGESKIESKATKK